MISTSAGLTASRLANAICKEYYAQGKAFLESPNSTEPVYRLTAKDIEILVANFLERETMHTKRCYAQAQIDVGREEKRANAVLDYLKAKEKLKELEKKCKEFY